MEYQTEEGDGVMYGYPVPDWPDTSDTDTRAEETRDNPGPRSGCEGCEHWQQQFATAIQNYSETQAALQSDLINLAEQQNRMVQAFNTIGSQQQQMWDGIGNLMKFMNSIASDLSTMSVMDKVKLARQLMGDKD